MPACRQMSLTGTPASAYLRIETIWVSVKRDFFMEPPGWGKHARKFYLWGVCGSGKLTPTPRAPGVSLAGLPDDLGHRAVQAGADAEQGDAAALLQAAHLAQLAQHGWHGRRADLAVLAEDGHDLL